MTFENALIQVMREMDELDSYVWMGRTDIWGDAYVLKYPNGTPRPKFPPEKWKSVYAALKRSDKFEHVGYIKAIGFTTDREMDHPTFKLKEEYK
jgi:hypothetical protein